MSGNGVSEIGLSGLQVGGSDVRSRAARAAFGVIPVDGVGSRQEG